MKRRKVTLRDFEIRYCNIRRDIPGVKKCSVKGCKNPRDFTELLGPDTSCAYHRLLFDYWSADVVDLDERGNRLKPRILEMTRKGRRRAFTNWMNRTGRAELDNIVLKLAQDPINWEC